MKRLKENLTNILLIIVVIVCTCILYGQNKNIQWKQDLILWNTNMIYENKVSYDYLDNKYEDLRFQTEVLLSTIEGYWWLIQKLVEYAEWY